MSFLDEFNKDTNKMTGIATSSPGPKFWISIGNYVLNKVISGKYKGGIGQGKLAMLAGPSSAGKSFLTGNIIRSAQEMGLGILILDSENAMDTPFLEALGVDTTDEMFVYRGVTSIDQSVSIVSKFIKAYRKNEETTPFLIVIDSLDALMTESEINAFTSGETKGDQGQQAKQLKRMLAPFMHEIKDLNIAILCTKQVYKTQDSIEAKNPITEYKMTEALKYPFSQILLISRLFLKDDVTKKYEGMRLRAFGLKTRFGKPFQQAVIEVPYDTGMDPYTGLLDAAVASEIVTRNGAWYTFKDKKFQSKNFDTVREDVLEEMILHENSSQINVQLDEDEIENIE